MRSLLRWAGSKRQLLPQLRPYWSRSLAERYVEPFAGSAALFFDLEPKNALLSDTNPALVAFYSTLRDFPSELYELAYSWPAERATYYEVRALFRHERDPIRRGAMFFYLNRNCFNGIFRTNLAGEFNVPFAPAKTGALPGWAEVEGAVSLLKRAEIVCADFRPLLGDRLSSRDFVYLDPPYAVENRRVFVQYNARTFGISDLEQLSDLLHCIDAAGARFVLSYAVSTEALECFQSWNVRSVTCQRNVAGFSAHRRKATELIVSNFAADGALL